MKRIFTAMLLIGTGIAWSATAAADPYGSAQRSTRRSCAATAATDPCDGTGTGQQITDSVYGGGQGVFGSADLDMPNGSYAHSTVERGDLALPVIRGETRAIGDERLNVNPWGFQSYTFDGPTGTTFSLTANLHIVDSSTDGGTGTLANGAVYSAYVAVWDPAILNGLNTPEELFNNLFFARCDTDGVLGYGFQSGGLPGGEQSYSVSTTACPGRSLELTNGQQVLAVAGIQLPVNRGGSADSTHTFVVSLDPRLSQEDRNALMADLAPAGVPEPATWATLIGGFGMIGGLMRRRRKVAAFA